MDSEKLVFDNSSIDFLAANEKLLQIIFEKAQAPLNYFSALWYFPWLSY